jgi:disulfide bond formation protein DsbB
MTEALSIAFAVLAVGLQALLVLLAIVGLLSLVWRPARTVLREVRDTLLGGELWIAWGIAAIATIGSLWYSEAAEFVPCRLCWFQRIAMYPLAVLLLVAAIRRDTRAGVYYAFVFPIAGALVSAYHLYIEANPDAESEGCKVGVPCSTKWIDEFGYVTIPMLAITAFLTIAALLAMAWSRRDATP